MSGFFQKINSKLKEAFDVKAVKSLTCFYFRL